MLIEYHIRAEELGGRDLDLDLDNRRFLFANAQRGVKEYVQYNIDTARQACRLFSPNASMFSYSKNVHLPCTVMRPM